MMKRIIQSPLWVLVGSLWLRREQTVVQKMAELSSDLRLYIESLDALYYHTPVPGNKFERWLVQQIHNWIDAEKAAARGLILNKMDAVSSPQLQGGMGSVRMRSQSLKNAPVVGSTPTGGLMPDGEGTG